MLRAFVFLACCALIHTLHADLRPHRASYTLRLQHVDPNSDIQDVRGTMTFDLQKEGTTWILTQDSASALFLKNGDVDTLTARYRAWESDDGQHLRFDASQSSNAAPVERISGTAHFHATGGSATFTQPDTQTFLFTQPVLGPVARLQYLRRAAQDGQHTLPACRVFDGSSYGTEVRMTTFIAQEQLVDSAMHGDGATRQWPIHMAVFAHDDETGLPTFRLIQNLSPDGAMRSYTIDLGEYAVTGTLEKIDFY